MPRARRAPTTSFGCGRCRPTSWSRCRWPTSGRADPRAGRPTWPGCSGRCAPTATRCAGSTSPSTARCRWAPGCRARRRSSAPSGRRPATCSASGCSPTTPAGPRLAAACVRAENEVAGAPTGGMDQSAALLCRADHALLLDCRSGATEQVPFDLAGDGIRRARSGRHGIRPRAAGHRHPRRAQPQRRPVRRAPRRLRAGGGRARGGVAARRRPRRPRRRPGPPLRRRAAPPHPPRGHRDRAGAGDGRGAARRRPGRGRAAVRRLARLAARRLRGELRRARRLGRGGPRPPVPWAPG